MIELSYQQKLILDNYIQNRGGAMSQTKTPNEYELSQIALWGVEALQREAMKQGNRLAVEALQKVWVVLDKRTNSLYLSQPIMAENPILDDLETMS